MATSSPGSSSRRTPPKGGRTTPKGGHAPHTGRPTTATDSGRYTPPIPQSQKVSPVWIPVLMFALLGLGALTIVLNYMNLLPGDTSNWYLLLGLGFITGGFITATNYR